MPSTTLEKRQLRWLLRVLCDLPFLRLYVDAAESSSSPPIQITELEHLVFHALPTDDEHRQESRPGAWEHLRGLLQEEDTLTAPQIFQRLTCDIRTHLSRTDDDKQRRLPAYYGLDFLFQSLPQLAVQPPGPPKLQGYVETHAHFRGSVPQDTHWLRLMNHARLRAAHREEKPLEVGTWKKTRAELLELAHHITQELTLDAALEDLRARAQLSPRAAALLALRANFGRHLTSQRGQDGLTVFTNHYDRFSKASKRTSDASKRTSDAHATARDDAEQLIAALDRFADAGVHAVELRPTLERTRIDLQRKLRPLVLGYFCHLQQAIVEDKPCVRLGLVLSLFKQELSVKRAKSHPDGSTRADWVDEQRALWCRQIEGLLDVLDEVPPLRLFVVGVDAAGREQGCPVRDIQPAFDLIHDYHRRQGLRDHTPGRRLEPWIARLRDRLPKDLPEAHDLERQLANAQDLWDKLCDDRSLAIPHIRLGLTMHAGEDFCDPMTGLREIWEAIDHLGLRHGDRLGHALAASLNHGLLSQLLKHRANTSNPFVQKLPGDSSNGYRLTKPLGVHLLDEAWTYHLASSDPQPTLSGGDLLLAAARAFAVPSEAHPLSEHLARALPTAAPVPGLHFYELEKIPPDLRTQVIIDDIYRDRFERLRGHVLDKIRRAGIFIESCPTSNIVVAGLHAPPLETFLVECPKNVTLASDDPAIFNSWPDHELHRYGGDGCDGCDLIANSARATFI
ncbi:MAG: hypothetical protein IPK72_08650 [Candidatus Eisenbacteria bacterium]|nr:hypothetical protein [Candidatus Eisenbacteria bacterium]